MARSVRADVKPNVAPACNDSCRMRTYSSTMYSETSVGTRGSNCRACEIMARMNAESYVSNSSGGCSSYLSWASNWGVGGCAQQRGDMALRGGGLLSCRVHTAAEDRALVVAHLWTYATCSARRLSCS